MTFTRATIAAAVVAAASAFAPAPVALNGQVMSPDDRALFSLALSCQFCDMGATTEYDIESEISGQVAARRPQLQFTRA